MRMALEFDYVVIGTGSAGSTVAGRLAESGVGTVCALEAGPSDAAPQVKVPFGLLQMMGSGRDWRFRTVPQAAAGGRQVSVNRGRMVGGSGSINSMVWFRGRRDDFDGWGVPGWTWAEVGPAFEAVEERIQPGRIPSPHPLAERFGRALGSNGEAPPTPERESAGVFHANMRNGRRWSSADAFLRPGIATGRLEVLTGANVDRIALEEGRARSVHLIDGRIVTARRGIVLSAGSIGSPAILMRSGLGPAAHLRERGIDVVADLPGVGDNLHDHPAVGLHHHAPTESGYGLTARQLPAWALSPFRWLLRRDGRMASNFVEAGAFYRAAPVGPDGDDRPDVQSHFIPYMMGWKGKSIVPGSGYFVDVGVCRPVSRGRLRLASADPRTAPAIDLGLLSDPADLATLVAGVRRLRAVLAAAPLEALRVPEVFPGPEVETEAQIAEFVRARCGTAYHPVGTLRIGKGESPVAPDLRLRGVAGLWVADASVMPRITSANTNASSIMIGHRAAEMIAASA
jgi:choline dehydrogenase